MIVKPHKFQRMVVMVMDGGRRPGRRRDATINDDMFIFAGASSLEKLIKVSRGDVGQFSDVLYLKLGVSDLVLRAFLPPPSHASS